MKTLLYFQIGCTLTVYWLSTLETGVLLKAIITAIAKALTKHTGQISPVTLQ